MLKIMAVLSVADGAHVRSVARSEAVPAALVRGAELRLFLASVADELMFHFVCPQIASRLMRVRTEQPLRRPERFVAASREIERARLTMFARMNSSFEITPPVVSAKVGPVAIEHFRQMIRLGTPNDRYFPSTSISPFFKPSPNPVCRLN
jgi:nucleotide-binding universal stress UspA family protein